MAGSDTIVLTHLSFSCGGDSSQCPGWNALDATAPVARGSAAQCVDLTDVAARSDVMDETTTESRSVAVACVKAQWVESVGEGGGERVAPFGDAFVSVSVLVCMCPCACFRVRRSGSARSCVSSVQCSLVPFYRACCQQTSF